MQLATDQARDEALSSGLGLAAGVLLIISLLNLPGLLATFTQAPGTASQDPTGALLYFALAGCLGLYLLLRHMRWAALSVPFVVFAAFFIVYLLESSIYSLFNGNFDPIDRDALIVHVFEFFLICVIYFWAVSLSDPQLTKGLRYVKYILLAGALSIVLSSYLPLYQGPKSDRAAGFYIDANGASVAALCSLVLVAAFPSRSRLWTAIQAAVALTAVLMTFSRTGLLSLFFLLALFALDRPSLKSKALSVLILAALGGALWFLIDSGMVPLDYEQRQRLADVGSLMSGDTEQKTSDHRSVLFDIGLERIKENFPAGAGMGEFHALDYGVRHYATGHWLGVHNTYLMILGEAGFTASVLFVAFWALMFSRIFTWSLFRRFSVGITIVLLFSMMTTHSVLNDKVAAVVIGLLLAATARIPQVSRGPQMKPVPGVLQT